MPAGSASRARAISPADASTAVPWCPRFWASRARRPSPQRISRVRFFGGGTSSKNAGEYFQYASKSGVRAHRAQLEACRSQCSRDTTAHDARLRGSAVVVRAGLRPRYPFERFDVAREHRPDAVLALHPAVDDEDRLVVGDSSVPGVDVGLDWDVDVARLGLQRGGADLPCGR